MKFEPTPELVLSEADTLALANGTATPDLLARFYAAKYRHKSPSLCAFLNELERTGGFVYNSTARAAYEKANGLPSITGESGPLGSMIYMAQQYRASDKAISEGWRPLLPDMVREAIRAGKQIEVMGESILGNVQKLCRPVEDNGQCFVLLPRKRNKGFRADGQTAARIAA